MKFVGRFSGIVAYSDDSHQQFAAHIDERGNISVNSGDGDTPNESNQALVEVIAGQDWLESMLSLCSATLTLIPVGSAVKVVTSAAMQFSGRVAKDDGTWEDFAVQYEVKAGGAHILNSSGDGSGITTAYAEFTGVLDSWLASLVGAGNFSLT
jgi:hypothetical protein